MHCTLLENTTNLHVTKKVKDYVRSSCVSFVWIILHCTPVRDWSWKTTLEGDNWGVFSHLHFRGSHNCFMHFMHIIGFRVGALKHFCRWWQEWYRFKFCYFICKNFHIILCKMRNLIILKMDHLHLEVFHDLSIWVNKHCFDGTGFIVVQ